MTTQPIFSKEAEQAILGSIFQQPELIHTMELEPAEFYIERNRCVWQAFQELARAGRGIDHITVTDVLDSTNKLAIIGGASYLVELLTSTPFGMHPSEYADIIRDKADRRRALVTASAIAKAAYSSNGNFQEQKAKAVDALMIGISGSGDTHHISEFASRLYDEVEERSKEPLECYGIPTGFKDYDKITAGLQRKELLILSGEPGLGKTLFAVQAGVQMAESGFGGAIFELEMGGIQLVRRVVSAKTSVPTRAMRSGKLGSGEWLKVTQAIEKISEIPLYVSDDTSWTTTGIRASLTKLKVKHDIEWFMVDYMNLLTDRYGKDDAERTGHLSKSLRRICKDLNLAGLAIHSMNKSGMGGTPQVQHLGGTARVGYDADMIVFMVPHKPAFGEQSDPNMRTLIFAKYREDDPYKFVHLVKRPGLPAFGDYAY